MERPRWAPEECGTFHFPGVLVELDVGEIRDAADGEEHDKLAVCMSEFGAADMDVANLVSFELLAFFGGSALGKLRDAMALKTTMQCASAPVWNGVFQTAEDVVWWQECREPELDDDGFFGRVRTVLFAFGSIGASEASARLRHFRTVFTFNPYWLARRRAGACAAWSSSQICGVVRALP
jgi:hypothetical protein